MAELPDPGAFGAAFVEFMHAMSFSAEHKESEVTVRLREHLGADPKELPTTGAEFPLTEHANLQLAIDAVLSDTEIVGFTARHAGFGSVGLAELVAGQGMTGPISVGPVQYTDVEVGDGRVIQCIASAMFLTTSPRGARAAARRLAIGRELAPATFVFEDVDLVAAERTMPFDSESGLLFELLNQMEGLAEDEDLLFLLTTNRPDLIEPALAARPGRIDLALEIPLPDNDGRRRLIALYGQGIAIDQTTQDALVERSAGVSGAFIKELTRQAWLRGALDDRDAPTGEDVLSVLDEMLEERSTLTRRLLGQPAAGAAATHGEGPFPTMLHALGAAGLPIPPSPSISGDQPGPS